MEELNLNDLEKVTGGVTVVATRDDANIRENPGTSSEIIGKTIRGLTATLTGGKVTRNGRTWLEVNYKGRKGWVCSDYLKLK